MKTAALLLTVALATCACSSQPSMDRPGSPDRPEVMRPEGVEPEGLTQMRDTIGAQRAEARANDNALNVNSSTATTPSDQTLLESIFSPVADVMQSIRTFIFGGPTISSTHPATAQATR